MIKLFNWATSAPGRLNPSQERDVMGLVQLGREVEAVRQIRRWTGLPLPAAVNLVADYRRSLSPLAGD